jgi:hypothetical protein
VGGVDVIGNEISDPTFLTNPLPYPYFTENLVEGKRPADNKLNIAAHGWLRQSDRAQETQG